MTAIAAIRILGPVELTHAGASVPLGGPLVRGFLGLVALEAPRPVSLDRLTALLWGDDAPSGVKAAVQQLATRVRRALAAAGLAEALRAAPPGYVLHVPNATVDLVAFRSATRHGVQLLKEGRADDAAGVLTGGLRLWRGDAFADLVDLPLAALLAPMLDDERWRAEELRAEALLTVGRASDAAVLLADACAAAPLRERLWELQAKALTAAGRPADGLRAVRTGIAAITAQLGVPPGPDLAGLETALRSRAVAQSAPAAARGAAPAEGGLLQSALRQALTNAQSAAIAASARVAHGEAVRQWQRALELLDAVDPGDERTRLSLLLHLGDAHNAASLASEAWTVFGEAVRVARDLGDERAFAAAVLGYCSDRTTLTDAEPTRLLHEALRLLGSDERQLRGRVLGRLATEEYWTGSVARTFELAEEALRHADDTEDGEGRLMALNALAFAHWTPERDHDLTAVCDRYLDEARTLGDRRHELLAHRWLTVACTQAGDLPRAAREAAAAMELADELGLSTQQWVTKVLTATHLLVAGDLDRAEALATEALALGSVSEPDVALDYVSVFLWTTRWLQGRLGEIAGMVEEVASHPGADLVRRAGLALTHSELGRPAAARAVLDGITADEIDAIPQNSMWCIALAAMAEAAAGCEHVAAAQLVVDRLWPYRDRVAMTTVTSTGPVAHHAGISAWTAGRRGDALDALAQAVEIAERIGAPVFAERSRAALACRLAR